MSADYSHLVHIGGHDELQLYELIPGVVWIFDLDKHGWWWGNEAAIKFWGLECLEDLMNKDLSEDTQGARDRTKQTFDLAVKKGLTIDPWTTYPGGKPKTLFMMHRAVLLGPDKHRGIIAYINEEVNLGETPENLLLTEAMRYTMVLVTSFTLEGEPVVENPAATESYKSLNRMAMPEGLSTFAARFQDPKEGTLCLQKALEEKGGRWTHMMRTDDGVRRHTLDIRMSRHALSGDYMLLVTEYDVSELYDALEKAKQAEEKLRTMAHYDALTGIPNQYLFQETARNCLAQADRHGHQVALLFIDLDGFKLVNDTWGHAIGDEVLKEVARRLDGSLRDSDLIARMGGDEFVLLATEVHNRQDVEKVAQKVVAALSDPVQLDIDGQSAFACTGASVGIAMYPNDAKDVKSLLKIADGCMYQIKREGKSNYVFAASEEVD